MFQEMLLTGLHTTTVPRMHEEDTDSHPKAKRHSPTGADQELLLEERGACGGTTGVQKEINSVFFSSSENKKIWQSQGA